MEFIIKSLILGLVQGLTEFLPVSSSGHLILAEHFMGMGGPGVALEVLLHVGTLAAVLVYFRSDIFSMINSFVSIVGLKPVRAENFNRDKQLIIGIIVGTIPTGIIGVLGKDWFEGLFSRVDLVGGALLVTAVLLFAGESLSKGEESDSPGPDPLRAFIVGIVQGIAIIPGISRSGITVATCLMLGIKPAEAARFSFLLSIPAIMGALVLSLDDLAALSANEAAGYAVGMIGAALVGYVAIGIFIAAAKKARLKWFSAYCAVVGIAAILAFSIGA